jgi:glycosyltransferase involved in cell wall biosynthesis
MLIFAAFLAKLVDARRVKWVVDVWDIPIRCHGARLFTRWRCRAERFLVKWMFRAADLFIVSIHPDFEFRDFRVPKSKLFAINNAIWRDEAATDVDFTARPNNMLFNILCMRSYYTLEMGLDTLAEAFELLVGSHPDVRLAVVGRIPSDVERQTSRLKELKEAKFYGYVKRKELMRILREADVCVIPFKDVVDLAQTYPLKVLEYFAFGKAVVASDLTGMSTMINDGINGLLFRAGDGVDLAAKIEKVYLDADLRRDLGVAAAQLDEKYDVRVKNSRIYHRLRTLVDGGEPTQ